MKYSIQNIPTTSTSKANALLSKSIDRAYFYTWVNTYNNINENYVILKKNINHKKTCFVFFSEQLNNH